MYIPETPVRCTPNLHVPCYTRIPTNFDADNTTIHANLAPWCCFRNTQHNAPARKPYTLVTGLTWPTLCPFKTASSGCLAASRWRPALARRG